jgi:hypothetical protein
MKTKPMEKKNNYNTKMTSVKSTLVIPTTKKTIMISEREKEKTISNSKF